jgi:phosphohistidine phosphatase
MGRYLQSIDEVPEVVITSTAVRASSTARLARKAGNWSVEVAETRELYGASPSSVLELVHRLPHDVVSAMLVGHEPTWSASIRLLSAGGGVQFPTAAMASIQFDVDNWSDVEPGGGRRMWLVVPRSLPDDL